MDITKILEELRQEREQIDEAILTLERLVQGRGRRRVSVTKSGRQVVRSA